MVLSGDPSFKGEGLSLSTLGSVIDSLPERSGRSPLQTLVSRGDTERGVSPSLDRAVRVTATEKPAKCRRRHDLWQYANALVGRTDLFWNERDDVKSEVVRCFQEYVKDVSDKVLVLHNEREEGGEVVVLPYKTRVDADYVREMRSRLSPLKKIKSDRAVMMTLTTNPSRWGSLAAAYHGLLYNFHRLMTWLVKRYGSPLQYLVVPEFTKSGIPHLHVVVLGVTYLVPQAEISEAWSRYGQGSIVDVRRCGLGFRNSSVFHYVLKYVQKSWDLKGDEPANLFHVAALWALGGRSFNCSRGLLEVKARVKLGFVYLGSWARNLIENLFDRGMEWGRSLVAYSRLRSVLCVGL